MFTKTDARNMMTTGMETQGFFLVFQRGITDLQYTDSYPVVKIAATVRDNNSFMFASLELDESRKRLVSSNCMCAKGRHSNTICPHKAALLLVWAQNRENGLIQLRGEAGGETPTDRAVMQFLRNRRLGFQADRSGTIFLEPHAEAVSTLKHALKVEFRIGREGTKGYVLKRIGDLISAEENESQMRFGKNLEFTPCEDSFNYASKPLYLFFKRLAKANDTFEFGYDRYGFYSDYYDSRNDLPRVLSLRGHYLDEFFDAIKDLPISIPVSSRSGFTKQLFHLSNEPYQPAIRLQKKGKGLTVSNCCFTYLQGAEYLYLINTDTCTIHRVQDDGDPMLKPVLDLVCQTDSDPLYINSRDVQAFTEQAYPVLSRYFDPDFVQFDPARYLPPVPSFAFYLDLPQDGLLTCEAYACYDADRYNIYESTLTNEEKRNIPEEKGIDTAIAHWFNSFDPANRRMAIIDDDDRIVSFLTDGIPFLKARGEVYISDALKRLQIRSLPRVSIGVSLSNDLLQLNIAGEQKSLEDLAEILSRYTPKKKYYRLKNGSFIKVDNEEELSELARITEDLELSGKQIRSGDISIPAYRAMYLEKAAEESGHLQIDRDGYFRDLIHQMDDTDQTYEVPDHLKEVLRDYQKTGYCWLRRLYDNHFAGLLADEMGLGKTLQVIAFLASLKQRKQALIVCPASLVYNWQSEFRRFAPELPVSVIVGSASQRANTIAAAAEDAVLITSYDALKRDIDCYEGRPFEVEVLDEAQYIKNANTIASESVKAINARFRIALTGTPIENRLSELWSIFDYLMPGFLYRYTYFKKHFESPIVKSRDKLTQEALRKMVGPFILRRRKTEVLTELPEKLEEVYYAPLEGEQRELYEARRQQLRIMLGKESEAEFRKNRIAVLAEITRLRQTCCAPSLIYENYKGNSAKEDLCMELIKAAVDSGHKILLFSQFKTMLEQLNRRLEEEGIAYYFLSGDTSKEDRAGMVESFQHDETPVFSISLKAGGTGLNLTAADIVIHYDPWWNTAVENQASDRTHRIGQTKVVTVYRLIVQDTIEERILQLQEKKADLAGEILSGDELSSSSLTKDQLMEIL